MQVFVLFQEASYLTDTSLGNLTDTQVIITVFLFRKHLTIWRLTFQESLFSNPEPRNPFLKSNKQVKPGTSNPLSLTDKYAGYTVEEPKKEKENRNSLNNGSVNQVVYCGSLKLFGWVLGVGKAETIGFRVGQAEAE